MCDSVKIMYITDPPPPQWCGPAIRVLSTP